MSPTLVRLFLHECLFVCLFVCLDRPCVIYAEKLDAIFTTTLKWLLSVRAVRIWKLGVE